MKTYTNIVIAGLGKITNEELFEAGKKTGKAEGEIAGEEKGYQDGYQAGYDAASEECN